ncbi:MAG: hypothetical protein ACW96M_02260 [Candidatus Thorarchaeota archaeon]|jgi:hypothetical protein
MKDSFKLHLSKIQPSQLYISQSKLNRVLEAIERGDTKAFEPIPIKEIDGELVSTDGHTRAVAWLLSGNECVDVEWEDEELDWEAYQICVQWCKDEGITTIPDLNQRVISHEHYEVLWYERCRVMQEDLEQKRRDKSV